MRTCAIHLGVLVGLCAAAAVGRTDEKPNAKAVTEVGGRTLKQWIADISHRDPAIREAAIQTVALFGRDGRKAGKALILELKDQDPSLRVNAAIALGIVGFETEEDGNEAVKALGRLLTTDPQAIVRLQAAVALGNLGPAARGALPQMRTALRDASNSWAVRRAVALALSTVAMDRQEGPDPATVMTLTVALKDYCIAVRRQAALALLNLGKPAKSEDLQKEKAALENVLRDRDQDRVVLAWVHVVLMRITKVTETHLSAVALMLKSPEPVVRATAAQALGLVGPEARSRVPDLIAALEDKEESVVAAAITALVQLEAGEPAISALRRVAEGKNEAFHKVVDEAIKALSGKKAQPAAPADLKKKVP